MLVLGLASSCARRPSTQRRARPGRQLSFEQFAGGWDLAWVSHTVEGRYETGKAQLLFSWEESRFLTGRGMESVVLGRGDLLVMWFPDGDAPVAEYGTTRCFRDPAGGVGRVYWLSCARGRIYSLTEHRFGGEVVMNGSDLHGRPIRWVFSDVAPDSFHWRSVAAADHGTEWRILEEFDAYRVPGAASA